MLFPAAQDQSTNNPTLAQQRIANLLRSMAEELQNIGRACAEKRAEMCHVEHHNGRAA